MVKVAIKINAKIKKMAHFSVCNTLYKNSCCWYWFFTSNWLQKSLNFILLRFQITFIYLNLYEVTLWGLSKSLNRLQWGNYAGSICVLLEPIQSRYRPSAPKRVFLENLLCRSTGHKNFEACNTDLLKLTDMSQSLSTMAMFMMCSSKLFPLNRCFSMRRSRLKAIALHL